MRRDRQRLLDVLKSVKSIDRYIAGGKEAFYNNELIQTWVLYHLLVIGEACRALSSAFTDQHPEVPWSEIVGLRNLLVHEYFGVKLDVVWSVVTDDLPELKRRIEAILEGLPDTSEE